MKNTRLFWIDKLRLKLDFSRSFSVDRVERNGGVDVFWRSRVACSIFGYSQNHIDLMFEENGLEAWRLLCFYGFPDRSRMRESWNFICMLSNLSNVPWCIVGDFNDPLYNSDKKGVHVHPNALLEGFRKAANDCEFLELDLCGGRFN